MRLYPYNCSEGKLTLGIGRNLDDRGITEEEALYLLNNDIEAVQKDLTNKVGVFGVLFLKKQEWYVLI